MAKKFDILFEDTHLIVLCKPAGLLSQGEHTGDENLVDLLREHFGRNYVGLVHRLDRNTSGIMVVAKRSKSAERLTQSLQEGSLRRSYIAWLEGALELSPDPIRWDDWLLRDERTNMTRVAKPGSPGAKRASLEIRTLRHEPFLGHTLTLCEFELDTGRSHQIRAQASARRHPLLGDRKYGGRLDFPRTALHSHRIEFPHPMSKEKLQFECPLPDDLELRPRALAPR
jgi:23S rRNA pseudouridine1911/1915/1917 synthase